MGKTLAQLKRDAVSGNLFVEMVERYGETKIPERISGIRQVVDANSVGIKIMTKEKVKSELRIGAASLVEYTDDELIIYDMGHRPLNNAEQRAMDGWRKITDTPEYQKQMEIDCLSDGSQCYYKQRRYFYDCRLPYLFMSTESKKYDSETNTIIDNTTRGRVSLRYRIVKEQEAATSA